MKRVGQILTLDLVVVVYQLLETDKVLQIWKSPQKITTSSVLFNILQTMLKPGKEDKNQ